MQFELKRIQREVGITFVFVTHDQGEALTMSDRIAVMSDGRVEQIGTPQEIYNSPASLFVAGFIGSANLLPGRGRRHATATRRGRATEQRQPRSGRDRRAKRVRPAAPVSVMLRPERLTRPAECPRRRSIGRRRRHRRRVPGPDGPPRRPSSPTRARSSPTFPPAPTCRAVASRHHDPPRLGARCRVPAVGLADAPGRDRDRHRHARSPGRLMTAMSLTADSMHSRSCMTCHDPCRARPPPPTLSRKVPHDHPEPSSSQSRSGQPHRRSRGAN